MAFLFLREGLRNPGRLKDILSSATYYVVYNIDTEYIFLPQWISVVGRRAHNNQPPSLPPFVLSRFHALKRCARRPPHTALLLQNTLDLCAAYGSPISQRDADTQVDGSKVEVVAA